MKTTNAFDTITKGIGVGYGDFKRFHHSTISNDIGTNKQTQQTTSFMGQNYLWAKTMSTDPILSLCLHPDHQLYCHAKCHMNRTLRKYPNIYEEGEGL